MVDWQAYSIALLTLLDRIDVETEEEHIWELAHQRFELAKQHGFDVEISGTASASMQ